MEFDAKELKNIERLIEMAFRSGQIAASQDAGVALMLQQKCRQGVKILEDALPLADVEEV